MHPPRAVCMFPCKWITVVVVLLSGFRSYSTPASVCPAAPFRPSVSPGANFTTQCSSVHPSLNPRGAITWQCRPDSTWEADWSGCTFPEGVSRAVTPLAYRVAAGESEVQNNIQTITSEVQALLQSISLTTFGDIHMAYSGPGADSEETILVLTLQVEQFFDQNSFQMIATLSASNTQMNYTLAGLLASPVWLGGPALREFNLCSCPNLWSSLESDLGPGEPIVNLCASPDYIDTSCKCQSLQNDATCVCSESFITHNFPTLGRVCRLDTDGDGIPNADPRELCEGCCLAQFAQGHMWPRTLHGITSQVPCASNHNRLGSFALRTCQPNGTWTSVDVSKCVLMDNTLGAIVILADVDRANADIAMQDVNGLLQQFSHFMMRNGVTGLSLRAAYATAGPTTTLVIEGDVPLMTDAAILSWFEIIGSPPGPVSFLQPPSVYGFQPVDECVCSPHGEGVNSDNWTQICSKTSNTACYCSGESDCQCLDPFVSVNTSSDPHLRCSLDSDGDGIPDHLDAEPFRYNSQVPSQENCLATVVQSCPMDTTSSPDISWSITTACMYEVQRCSKLLNETVGLAYRLCNSSGQWEEPDVRGCQSVLFRNVETTVNNILTAILASNIVAEGGTLELSPNDHDVEVLVNTTQMLLDATDAPSGDALLPADLRTTVVYLQSMASIAENTNLIVTAEFIETTLFSIVDNLLMSSNDPAWRAADTEYYSAAVTLLNVTEKLTSIVANSLGPSEVFTFVSNNLVIEARSIPMNLSGAEQFDGGTAANASVSIPGSIVGGENGASSIVVTFLNRLANFLPHVFANQSFLGKYTIHSTIISIQVNGVEGLTLSDALATSPIHLQFEGINGVPRCAFWNYSGHEYATYVIGGWSVDGLATHYREASMAVNCSSRHLTSFAVLVNVAGTNIKSHLLFLPAIAISYFGCALSLLCLVVTIAFLLVTMRKMKREKDHKAMLSNFVLCNLCIALACGLLVFLAGIEGAKSVDDACKTVAFLLHYFFLAAFFWMLCEAVMMYNLLVKVFRANEKKWAWFYMTLGWITPLPIVVISIASRDEQYLIADTSTNKTLACWLSKVHGTIYAFIAPMLLILLVNAILLAFVMWSLFKFYRDSRRRQFRQGEDKNEAVFLTWKLLKAFIIILPLLGFTWVLGLFAVNDETVVNVFAWFFVIFNSLQGTAIFFCYVVRSDQVWPKIVSLCKRCFSHKQPKITTTVQLRPQPIPESEMNNWTLAVAKSDAITSITVSPPSVAAQSVSNGVAGAPTDSLILSDDQILW